ncbi:MAG: site-2 protease family protein [Pseudomonadota bacterium]
MKWSIQLGRFAGIDVYIHLTFFLLLAWFGYMYWNASGTILGTANGLTLIILLFLCVLFHEYGHALMARRFGIKTRHITLLPIGGVALLERMPEDPRQEILVALAGPAVNVAIAVALFVVIALADRPGALISLNLDHTSILPTLLTTNIALVIFNLVPAFPMDGGRVLRALLAMRLDRVKATRYAARIGRGLAVLFGLLGLAGNPLLVLIAVFIWIGAGAEAEATSIDAQLSRKPVGLAMITEFQTLTPDDTLSRAVDLTLAGTQKDFPVVRNGQVLGVATQKAILRGLRDHGIEGEVHLVMTTAKTADVSTSLDILLRELRENDIRLVCITRYGQLAGLIDLDNITEYLRIQEALGRA